MGNDGGSIPKRRELVKEAARNPTVSELKATVFESLNHAWTHDPISSEPIDLETVVSDWRGRLYNYESILKGLTTEPGSHDAEPKKDDTTTSGNGESATPTIFATELSFVSTGIKSLRDVVKLKFKRYRPPGNAKEKEIFACPVTLKELGASTKSVYLVPCGHVFAEMAIQMITDGSTDSTEEQELCPECSEPFNKSEDVVPILPTDKADINRLSKRMEHLKAKGLTHSLKKDKSASKEKKNKNKSKRTADEANVNGDAEKEKETKKAKKSTAASESISSRVSGINNPATAALTARVLADQDEAMKRRKLAAAAGFR
ncbi:Rtf2 RING-finger-domain-containing protein [Pseudoneurospora amorphoporcata]|uniref:Rtf2 RING-finger-domain-containing protein n=1 Tax=Pseudoneurospora amorphoporcata TaxID=241081 RepID=A0AAN6NXM6_9PEZI|nr:Rtf2 RING-finger-domain-containing protein [Pseudoneurospora amorphoporcata]